MSDVLKEYPDEQLDAPTVKEGRSIKAHELVMLDGKDMVEILAWNNVPTFYVRYVKTQTLAEVEPWRLEKIEK